MRCKLLIPRSQKVHFLHYSDTLLGAQTEQAAEKLKTLSFRGTLRAEESLFSWVLNKERFLASLGMTP